MSLEVIAAAEKAEAEALRIKSDAVREAAARLASAEEAGRSAVAAAQEKAAEELRVLRLEYEKAAEEDEKSFLEEISQQKQALLSQAEGKLEEAARYIVEGIVGKK